MARSAPAIPDMNKLISTVITTKNRHHLVSRAIESVLAQDYPAIEVIVVDDGSDSPVRLAVKDPRVRLIRNERSVGLSAARNIGFRAAGGEYLSMLDDDDYYLPGKLSTQAAFLNERREVDLVFSRVVVKNGTGEERCYLGKDHVHSPLINALAFNLIHPSSVLFRRRVFEQIQFDEHLVKYEDTLFFNRVCFTFHTAYLPGDVSVWMQDGRPDQLTRVFFRRNYRNFSLVCEGLKDILNANPDLKRRYCGRVAYQALRCLRFDGMISALWHVVPGNTL
jgi:glycosyltransferase involved in cell wall biosynthesis